MGVKNNLKPGAILPPCRCGSETRLTNTTIYDGTVYRRYRCIAAGHMFTTEVKHKPPTDKEYPKHRIMRGKP